MTLLQLLHDGRIEEFNAKRGQRVTLDFFAVDFSECGLAGVDLSGATLEKGDLSQADLTGARLDRANLSGADLTGAKLDRCVAVKARLREACLEEASLAGAEFAGADLSEAELVKVQAAGVRMTNARLKAVSALQADLSGADLTDARLMEADLREADLSGAKLRSADLSKADLTGANLTGADLTGAKLAGAKLGRADLSRAVLVEADLSGADLTGATVDGADFTKADLFDVQAGPELLDRIKGAPPAQEAAPLAVINVQIDQAVVVQSGQQLACLWDNTPEEDDEELIICLSILGASPPSVLSLPLPAEQVLVRTLLPAPEGFRVVALLDSPGGVMLWSATLRRDSTLAVHESVRLGYTPVVQPVFTADGADLLIYGIGRQGVLSAHRATFGAGPPALAETLRAPAQTSRGFCGQLDPILLGKGGTLSTLTAAGISRLQTAPSGYPGRLTAAAADPRGRVAVAWSGREERGLRFQVVGEGEPVRIDEKLEIGSIALLADPSPAGGGRWLLCWTREAVRGGEATVPMARWMPDGKPFLLLDPQIVGKAAKEEIVEIRPVSAPTPLVAMQTFLDTLIVVAVGEDSAELRATLS